MPARLDWRQGQSGGERGWLSRFPCILSSPCLGVGIMNIMYVAVTERTAEIGLKKALGARNADILWEFLLEAVLVTLLGGAVRILWGTLLGFVVSAVAAASKLDWPFTVPLNGVLIALGVSSAIGLVFGIFPARRASRLDPIEAMRYE